MEGFADPHDGEVNLTIEMFVPSSQVGRIIGKGGTNVRELQRVTGAMIKLPEQLSPPPKDETSVVVIGKWIQVLVSIPLLYVALDDDSKLVFFYLFADGPTTFTCNGRTSPGSDKFRRPLCQVFVPDSSKW